MACQHRTESQSTQKSGVFLLTNYGRYADAPSTNQPAGPPIGIERNSRQSDRIKLCVDTSRRRRNSSRPFGGDIALLGTMRKIPGEIRIDKDVMAA
jgi:hypothetical protein